MNIGPILDEILKLTFGYRTISIENARSNRYDCFLWAHLITKHNTVDDFWWPRTHQAKVVCTCELRSYQLEVSTGTRSCSLQILPDLVVVWCFAALFSNATTEFMVNSTPSECSVSSDVSTSSTFILSSAVSYLSELLPEIPAWSSSSSYSEWPALCPLSKHRHGGVGVRTGILLINTSKMFSWAAKHMIDSSVKSAEVHHIIKYLWP